MDLLTAYTQHTATDTASTQNLNLFFNKLMFLGETIASGTHTKLKYVPLDSLHTAHSQAQTYSLTRATREPTHSHSTTATQNTYHKRAF